MKKSMNLSASLEDYIEAIFHIVSENKVARGKDIAARLKVSNASVTEALQSLAKKGLVNYAPYEVVTLTGKGRKAAEDVIRRHQILRDFFVKVLAVDEDIAEEGACRVEHAAPPEIIEKLIQFVDFVESGDGGGAILNEFKSFCSRQEPNQARLPGMK